MGNGENTMKRFIFLLTAIFICTIARADNVNINWIVGDNTYATTQCEMGNDLILPTAPTKTGYTFRGWRIGSYIPIEYLESTGTQYIDTGVVADETTEAEIEFSDMTATPIFMASNGGWTNKNFGINAGTDSGSVYLLFYMNCDGWTSHKIVKSGNVKLLLSGVYLNNEKLDITRGQIPSPTAFSTQYAISIFASNISGNIPYFGKFKLLHFKLWQQNVLVRDMIPVLDLDGVPCMFDKVEGKFYYNAGTGDFIAGPVLTE